MQFIKVITICCLFVGAAPALSQAMSPQDILEEAAEAMGGFDRIQSIESLLMTGFSQTLSQAGAASPHPMAPEKRTAQNNIERYFDLENYIIDLNVELNRHFQCLLALP